MKAMKKLTSVLLTLVLLLGVAPLSGMAYAEGNDGTVYTVTFDSAGGSAVKEQKIAEGGMANEPGAPAREGYAFSGWFTEKDTRFNFNTPITEDLRLVAKWIENAPAPSNEDAQERTEAQEAAGETPSEPETQGAAVEQPDEATPAPAVEENNAADDVAEPEQAAAEQADEVAPAPAVEENAADGITEPETQDTADETPDEPEFPEAIDKAPARGGLRGPGGIAIDAVNFPDANFRAFVAQYDLDSDGYLSAAELAAVTTMGCSGKSIASLQGVEFFTALTYLSCDDNNLTTLDVSQNTALTVLSCYGNNLATLDVSAVPALKDAVENGSHYTSNSAYDKYVSALGELYVDKTVTLVPAAPAATYTVTFDANGHGTAPAAQTVEDGKPAAKPADPTESGWTFGGWYKEAACTNAFDFTTPITADITLYAKWTKAGGGEEPPVPITYTVTFDENGHGTAPSAQTVESGKTATKPADPTETGWTFGGWYQDATCSVAFDFSTPITANITLYAKWTKDSGGEEPPVPITYTVSFDANGHGTAPFAQTVESGKTATKPADPTASGWTFGGWYKEAACNNAFNFSTPITGNITLYAKWTKVAGDPVPATKYTITYVLNGGKLDGKTGTVTVSVEDGATITLPKPTRSGYTFDYWEGSRYNAGASYTVTGDHTFTARWKSNTTGIGGNDTSPKTGDNSHIGLWIALMAISLIGLGGVTVYGKGRKRRTSR